MTFPSSLFLSSTLLALPLQLVLLTPLPVATSTPLPKPHNEKSFHEDEVAKTAADPILAISLEYPSKPPQRKAYHTSRLVRKVDFRLLSLLILMYLLNFLDRSNLAQARFGTLEKDLGMRKADFNLTTGFLFVVYVFIALSFSMRM